MKISAENGILKMIKMFAFTHCFNMSIFYQRKCLDDLAQSVTTALLIKRWVRCHLQSPLLQLCGVHDLNPGQEDERLKYFL